MRIANAYEELSFHALAFVPPGGDDDFSRASSLWDPRWHARIGAIDPSLVAGFADDHAVLAALARRTPGLVTLQGLPRLFDDLATFRATRRGLLAEIVPRAGIDDAWLAAIAAMPPELVEIVRAHMLLVSTRFSEVHATTIAPRTIALRDAEFGFVAAAREAFDLEGVALVLAAALGERGRGFGATIYVGADAGADGAGGLTALAVYERVVDVANAAIGDRTAAASWHAAETTAIDAYRRLVTGTALEGPGLALLERFAGFARDPAVPGELADRVVATLRRR